MEWIRGRVAGSLENQTSRNHLGAVEEVTAVESNLSTPFNPVTFHSIPRRPRSMSPSIPAMFIADASGLDFLNSIATPVDVPVDWIDDGEGLLAWLGQAKLVPAEVLNAMRERAMPGELDRLADQARSLREWFRAFVRERKGRTLEAADLSELEPLNLLLARDEAFGEIVAHEDAATGALTFERSRRWS